MPSTKYLIESTSIGHITAQQSQARLIPTSPDKADISKVIDYIQASVLEVRQTSFCNIVDSLCLFRLSINWSRRLTTCSRVELADFAKKEALDFEKNLDYEKIEKNLDFAQIEKKENGNDVDVEFDSLIAANV